MPCEESVGALPPRALEIWQARPDLQEHFDPSTPIGVAGLRWWYFLHAFGEMGLQLEDSDGWQWLNEPYPGLPQRSFTPITRLMFEMALRRRQVARSSAKGWLCRKWLRLCRSLGLRFDQLNRRRNQDALLAWFFTEGLANANLLDLLNEQQARALLEPFGDGTKIPRIVHLLWQSSLQLRSRFPNPYDANLLSWAKEEGYREWPMLKHPGIALAPARPAAGSSPQALPFGVNLFGHLRARLGIGEDVRMAALALDAAGVPFAIQDIAAGNIAAEEPESDFRLTKSMPFAFNLFCMTGMETVTTVLKLGRGKFANHFNIGFWPWELPQWPQFWQHAYGFIDEVWASTQFTESAFKASAPVRVTHMPMTVTVDASEGLGRKDFGLPEGQFLFAFAFDGLSSFKRKNPWACIEAFRRAFPDPDAPVGLVMKGLRVENHPEWHKLQIAAEADPRIRLLTGSFTRGALLDLFRAIDCFISLHRSEGFGRNIAEAMLLGKPVIATAFSGNMDFTTPATCFPVPYRETILAPGDYPFGGGQVWAEPDCKMAASLMRTVAKDKRLRTRIAAMGQRFVASAYAPGVVGEKYRSALLARYNSGAV